MKIDKQKNKFSTIINYYIVLKLSINLTSIKNSRLVTQAISYLRPNSIYVQSIFIIKIIKILKSFDLHYLFLGIQNIKPFQKQSLIFQYISTSITLVCTSKGTFTNSLNTSKYNASCIMKSPTS